MIRIKNLTIKNFMSVGNVSQAISFDDGQLTLVLGENLDLGGDGSGSRNGVGKCCCKDTVIKIRDSVINETYETTIEAFYNGATLGWFAGPATSKLTLNDTQLTNYHSTPTEHSLLDRKFINSIALVNLEIETDTGWFPLSSIHKTVPYIVWRVETESGLYLDCADTHILFDENFNEIFTRDIIENQTKIITQHGAEVVTRVSKTDSAENMFDVTVDSPTHRFYTNNILSHNTTIINGLSYALYGQALTNIKKDNLVNKINNKGMLVTVNFEINGVDYKIERGRKPNILHFLVNGKKQLFEIDESQGDSRETQKAIESLIDMSHDMFKHLVALNTYTEPFLAMRAADQRSIIEQLLGITQLSQKAEILKEQVKISKDNIIAENTKIETIKAANERINQSIASLERKQRMWNEQQNTSTTTIANSILKLSNINIDNEILAHRQLAEYNNKRKELKDIDAMIARCELDIAREQRTISALTNEINSLEQHTCHSCGQSFHDTAQISLLEKKRNDLINITAENKASNIQLVEAQIDRAQAGELSNCPIVTYDTLELALTHKATLQNLERDIELKIQEINPYTEQISELRDTALQPVIWDTINTMNIRKDHQEFLLKLLTNKDSFIRKRIIDQNLSFLNQRLTYYLDKIGLPHIVEFQNDLSVLITQLGQDLDFDNLSRGERNRLILSLSWAFRDVWESLYRPINLLFIDELIDSGLDASGVDASIAVLKQMSRVAGKNIFLISHRDDLTTRVNHVLRVVKENGFTSFSTDVEVVP